MHDTNPQPDATQNDVSVGRRVFMKLAAVGAGLSGATAGTVLITGRARATDEIEAASHGGQLSEITVDGNDTFDIEWNDVDNSGALTLGLAAGIRGEDNSAHIGETQIETPESSGSTTVTVAAFTDDASQDRVPVVARHPHIDPADISVDLDAYEPDSNQKLDIVEEKTIEFTVKSVHASRRSGRGPRGRARGRGAGASDRSRNSNGDGRENANGNGRGNGNTGGENSNGSGSGRREHTVTVEDSETIELTLRIKPILGCGIQFGEQFAVWNEFGPEENVSVH